QTGAEVLSFRAHQEEVWALAASPDGNLLASGGADGATRLWEAATGKLVRTMATAGKAHHLTFSPDGAFLAAAAHDWTARVWDTQTGVEVHVLRGHTAALEGIAFSPDGRHPATAGGDRTIKLWDAASGQQALSPKGHPGKAR